MVRKDQIDLKSRRAQKDSKANLMGAPSLIEDSSRIENVWFGRGKLFLLLQDGREIGVPLSVYPRLAHANPTDLGLWRLGADKRSIHWSRLDEDLSLEGIIQGNPSPDPDEKTRKIYAPAVLSARKKAGLTPELLADKLGLSPTVILLAESAQIGLLPFYVDSVRSACGEGRRTNQGVENAKE